MGSRGRKSAAELSISKLTVLGERRPAPPAELTEAEAAVWRDTVDSMPGTWFRRSHFPILTGFCRHAARNEFLAAQIAKFEPEWLAAEGGVERLNKLLAMAERETRAVTACARAMRLTHQAQLRASKAGTAVSRVHDGPRPWDWKR